ncbi:MAG: SDR family oxidoreductase [Sphingomonadaceae bacterium]|nr:SDR family oxidoreductase [Sphingomonadaceae bacterium]
MSIERLFGVAGKTVVITGGSRGIGEMIARAYVANGARVLLTARRAAELSALVAELGPLAEGVPADLSTLDGIEAFAAEVEARTAKVDVLFNNAGATWGETFDAFPETGWNKVMDLNVKSVFFLTRRLVRLLEAAAQGEEMARVINVGSIDGLHVSPMETYSYAASKAAVLHLTRMMAKFLAPRGILVNAMAPGYFPSRMTAGVAERVDREVMAATPLGRWGRLEDMAGVALFLGSRASAYLCGSVVVADGGYATTA